MVAGSRKKFSSAVDMRAKSALDACIWFQTEKAMPCWSGPPPSACLTRAIWAGRK